MGMGQLMPGTARDLGVTDPFNPQQNIDGSLRYFGQMLQQFGGDPRKADAAYNWGPGNLSRLGMSSLPPETLSHIARVVGAPNGLYQQGSFQLPEMEIKARGANPLMRMLGIGAPPMLNLGLGEMAQQQGAMDQAEVDRYQKLASGANEQLQGLLGAAPPPAQLPVPPQRGLAATFASRLSGNIAGILMGNPRYGAMIEQGLQQEEQDRQQVQRQNELLQAESKNADYGRRLQIAAQKAERYQQLLEEAGQHTAAHAWEMKVLGLNRQIKQFEQESETYRQEIATQGQIQEALIRQGYSFDADGKVSANPPVELWSGVDAEKAIGEHLKTFEMVKNLKGTKADFPSFVDAFNQRTLWLYATPRQGDDVMSVLNRITKEAPVQSGGSVAWDEMQRMIMFRTVLSMYPDRVQGAQEYLDALKPPAKPEMLPAHEPAKPAAAPPPSRGGGKPDVNAETALGMLKGASSPIRKLFESDEDHQLWVTTKRAERTQRVAEQLQKAKEKLAAMEAGEVTIQQRPRLAALRAEVEQLKAELQELQQ